MANTYTLIASNTLSSSAASVTFSAIPNTYTDLVLKVSARTDAGGVNDYLNIRPNSDSTTIYSFTRLRGDGVSATSARGSGEIKISVDAMATSGGTTNTFGSIEVYFPNYTTTANKPIASFGASEQNAASGPQIGVYANLFRNTSAISSLFLYRENGSNFLSDSSFFLYGIKNS